MTCFGLQGLVKVLDELIPEVLLSMSKPYITLNSKTDMHE
jgi:hypothetical protein